MNEDFFDVCLPLSRSDLMPPKAELSLTALRLGDTGRKGKVAKCNSVMLSLCSCCHALETAQSSTKKLLLSEVGWTCTNVALGFCITGWSCIPHLGMLFAQ